MYRIRGAMLDYLRDEDPHGRLKRTQLKRRNDVAERLQVKYGRPLTDDELEDELGPWERLPDVVSFDRELRFDERQRTFGELFAPTPKPDASAEDDAFRDRLRGLPMEDQVILFLYYRCEVPMWHIAEIFGCSESRISQRVTNLLAYVKNTNGQHREACDS